MTAKKDTAPERTELEKAEDAEALDVFEQFKALGTDLQVVTRREPGARYLEIVTLEGFDEQVMRERYGGGKFSLEVRREGKYITGSKKRHMEIEGVPKIFPAPMPDETNPEILRLRNEIEKLTGAPVAGVPASENVMVAVAGMMAPVLTALITAAMDRPAPADPLAILNLARKMAKDDRAEASGTPSGLDPILEHMGIPLVGAINKMTQTKDAEDPKALAPPDAAAQVDAPGIATARPQSIPEVAAFVARWCAPHCGRGTSPTLRAELLMEELTIQDPALYAAVLELSDVPDVLEHWVRMIPEVGMNKEWHGTFIEEVRAIGADAEEAESVEHVEPVEADPVASPDDTDRGRGNAGDDSGDAKTGEVGGPG